MDRLFVGRETDRTVSDGAMKALAPASRHTTRERTRENMVSECVCREREARERGSRGYVDQTERWVG